MEYIILSALAVLAISALAASKFEKIANMKGHRGYFWWCFLLGAIGWAMVIALPDDAKYRIQPSVNQAVSGPDDTLPEL